MKFKVSQQSLSKAVAFVSGAVERKQTLPVLANVLVVADGGGISITATNLEIQKQCRIDADIIESGSITVPCRKLADFAKNADTSKDINFVVKDAKATISSGRSRWSLSTLPATEYPEFATENDLKPVSINSSELLDAISKVSPMMADNDVRYYLNGMLLDIKENEVKVVATDGHRLGVVNLESSGNEQKQAIIPKPTIAEVAKLLSVNGNCSIAIGSSHIEVKAGDAASIKSKLVDGKFPDYTRVIPKAPSISATLNTSELRDALKRTMPLANEKYRGIRFTFTDTMLVMQANNQQQDEATEEIACNSSGNIEIGFNGDYLRDAAAALSDENATIMMSDSSASVLIEEGSYTAVVMPMRM